MSELVVSETPRTFLLRKLTEALDGTDWLVVVSERVVDETTRTVVRASVDAFRQHPKLGRGVYEVDVKTTITVAGSIGTAATEDRLDDATLEFLRRLDDHAIDWSGDWTKANVDGRLGYQGTVKIAAERDIN